MADKLSKDTKPDDATKEHNSRDRKRIIKGVIREIATLEAQRKAISEQIAAVKAEKIKGHLGMKIADFNAAYRLSQLEGDDREEFFDTLRETFEALGEGDQLDFIDAINGKSDDVEDAPQPEEEQSFTVQLANAYEAGRKAGAEGKNLDTCPYRGQKASEKKLRGSWETGWSDAQEQIATGLGKKPATTDAHAPA